MNLQDELQLRRRENEECKQKIQRLETIIARMRSSAQRTKDERDRFKKKVRELQTRFSSSSNADPEVDENKERNGPQFAGRSDDVHSDFTRCIRQYKTFDFRAPAQPTTPKVADRVRLTRLPTDDVDGHELCTLGVNSTSLAEHLAETVVEASQLQEMYASINTKARKKEFELELENLRRQANHMKSQISFFEITLNESRTLSDSLSSICAQLESNQTALQLVALLSDYAEDANDCLLNLADTQLALCLASCQAVDCHGSNDHGLLAMAKQERRVAEATARSVLSRLRQQITAMSPGDNELFFNDPEHEYAELEGRDSQGTKTEVPWSRKDENQLRDYLKIIISKKEAVRHSIVDIPLQEFTSQNYETGAHIASLHEQKLTLENVVLLQELMAVKEEKTRLKADAFVLQQQNELLTLSLRGKELEVKFLQSKFSALDNDETELEHNFLDNAASLNCARSQSRNDNFEEILKNHESHQQKNDEFIENLKRANESLSSKLERVKRKHKCKMRRFQQILRYVTEQYDMEISALRGRSSMEARDSGNETLQSGGESHF